MDGTEYMIKVLSRFRMVDFPELLKSWDVLSERQLQSVNFNRNTRKDAILQLAALCEDNGVTLKQIADLEIIYNCAYPQKRRWCTYQMFSSKGVEEAKLFDFEVFRKTFERNLKMLIRSVMINILEHGEAVWIRIAWGKRHSPPNQQRPSYVVHYPQTPYVFMANLAAQYRVHVSQALVVATEHNMLKELDLRGHCLNSLRDIALKRFNPTLSAHCRKPLQQLNSSQDSAQNQRITVENLREKEEAKRLTAAAFGEGSLPKLEEVQYRLQTVFKDERNMGILSDRNKPFRCVAKFSSPNILESLRALPELGIAEVPISTMFSSIPEKGKNYFKITDKRTGHNTSAL
ncbi:centromere protein N [Pristis pectinata]|uniref:centromere protein N n=1 Tax=Pristis pectinata TaxID=685728 RepID=UPI00223CD786|nr:centromere protein N [Pristis pectinata]XP_051884209.1 centromere protein N [Pristis pectinata]XP_051884210.1 centromere protein N [Pristis pectinata]XP_051884211.1 centromere protein N [Pristis pectinata]XP_051884212.1 centromere protein N [Pristis pectinata]XP_051884213.1 centromere protein N [Pristis pectinata]XP_051884214.1 centromere protein N [Pristis pectinata]XP_051884215.1 centromere protein N [Pristis pectinata]XP_051884217.1 centromere protein N [Pristis pectinata]XP_05188421